MIPVVSWMDLVPADTRIDTRLRDVHVDGNVAAFELDVINRLVAFHDPSTLFEIGTFDGRTTLNLAAHSRTDARVYTLDLSPAGLERTVLPLEVGDRLFIDKPASGAQFAGTSVEPKIVQLFGDSAVYDFRRFHGKIDFAFIDGSHAYDYVLQDSSTAIRLMRESGIILWHDYVREGPTPWPGVPRALGELYERDPVFRGLRQIAGTSIVFLQVPGPNSLTERLKARERVEMGRLDSEQPECLVASLRVKMARTSVREGQSLIAKVSAVNIGRATWLPEDAPRGPVRLGARLLDADGYCIDSSFSRNSLPGQPVAPGGSAEFEARLPCPPEGRYILEFDLVAEEVAWFSRNGSETVQINIEVIPSAAIYRNVRAQVSGFSGSLGSVRGPARRILRRAGVMRILRRQQVDSAPPRAMTTEAFVAALYRVCLGRAVDPAGLAAWTDVIRSTGDPSRVLQGIIDSPEYAARAALAAVGCAAEIRRARDAVDRPLRVVDVGGQLPGAGSHPYDLLRGVCQHEIIGFDPRGKTPLKHVAAEGAERLILLPYAVGDGGTHTLYVNSDDATSSLFPLNDAHNAPFNHLSELRTVRTEQVMTRRLDDVLPEGPVDFLELDMRGAELMVLQGAERTLSETAVVHCKVGFSPIYLGQPLFADIQQHLRARGFILIDLLIPSRYHYLTASRRVSEDRLLWGDVVFFQDTADPMVRKVQALVAASVYRKPTLSEHLLSVTETELSRVEPTPAEQREPSAA